MNLVGREIKSCEVKRSFTEDFITYQISSYPGELFLFNISFYYLILYLRLRRENHSELITQLCFFCLQLCNCQMISVCSNQCDVIKKCAQK